jgi:hypothetical protein
MELDYKAILWIITIIVWIYAYFPYIRDVLKGTTKPHMFSWIIFLIMDAIAFLIQIGDNAGPWSWGTLTTGLLWVVVLILAIKHWEKNITKSDCLAFTIALLCIAFYIFLEDPKYSLYLVLSISALALYPTARKSIHKPNEETLSIYVIAGVRSILSIAATINISLLTVGLPAFIICINTLFVAMVLIRRKQLTLK